MILEFWDSYDNLYKKIETDEIEVDDKTIEEIKNESYNQALEDFAEKMNRMLGATDLRDNGYYIENLVSIAKNELKIK